MLAGIDPSTKRVAIVGANLDLSDPWAEVVTLASPRQTYRPEATAIAVAQVERVLRGHGVDLTFIEEPLVGRGGVRTALLLGYVAGAVQAGAVQASRQVRLVNVQTWKRSIVGKGNALKPEVSEAVRLRWPEMHRRVAGDQDLIDAAAIFLYGVDNR